MWDKPKEITGYPGYGYEIAAPGGSLAQSALDSWLNELPDPQTGRKLHVDVILEQGMWEGKKWQWLVRAVRNGYAFAWFGEQLDPASQYRIASNPAVGNFPSGGVPTEHVFARNTNGDLIQYWWNPNQSWAAENLTQGGNIGTAYRIASDPAGDQFPEGDVPTQHVFARNTNGDLIEYWWNPNQSWAAETLTQRGNIGAAYRIASNPAVGNFPSGGVPTEHVFARNTNGDLIQYWWNPNQSWAAEDLTQRGNIGTAYRIASDPAVDQLPGGRCPDNSMYLPATRTAT